jgi:DNA-binding NtrC family response regulator
VRVNCPAIPEQLLESELFGHVKGAFTGADSAHKGLFMQAMGGTLLLDEVGDIPLGIQTKLLRTLQDGEVRPVGAARPVTVDVRIVAATNQDLEKKIKQGAFREDLFYRLNVLTIQTPSLRERRDDIPLLCAHFLGQACAEMAVAPKRIAPEAMAVIRQQDWPGNVRELQNLMRRVAVFSAGAVIELADVSLAGLGGRGKNAPAAPDVPSPYKEVKNRLVDSFTRAYMEDLLKKTGGNISEAARLSGLGRVSMQKILRRLGMDGVDFRK